MQLHPPPVLWLTHPTVTYRAMGLPLSAQSRRAVAAVPVALD
jgi:hypothetical protein